MHYRSSFTFLAISYNLPKFCSFPSWNPNGTTFASKELVGFTYGIFIDTNYTIYVTSEDLGKIIVWTDGNEIPIRIISEYISKPKSLFVALNGDIYVDNGVNDRIDMWTLNATSPVQVMKVDGHCEGLFIDIKNDLYCSLRDRHRVIKKSPENNVNTSTIAAGTGLIGKTSVSLWHPRGIFVNTNLDLYVADCDNNRIQLFRSGQLNGITVAGDGATETISLKWPTGIVLDADGYLFIVDEGNHRIVGSGPAGFRCLVGCSSTPGSQAHQLNYPQSMAFDRFGNMFITDRDNYRVQKFVLATDSCRKYNSARLTRQKRKMLGSFIKRR